MRIGDKVRYLRVKEDFTQKELAEKLGIKQNTLSDYERNITPISVNLIEKLSDIFGVEISYFSDEEEPKNFSVTVSNRMVLEDMIDSLISRGDIKSASDLDNEDIKTLLLQIMKKDIDDKLKKQL